jgi:DNA adenine methylase
VRPGIYVSTILSVTEVKPAPFLRWAGGKRKLVPTIVPSFPKSFNPEKNRFYEPFVGGGAVMFALGDPLGGLYVPGKRLVINDVNPDLICAYTVIRDDVESLIAQLRRMSKKTAIGDFEKVKKSRPTSDVLRAARFIYLNKTCFNGLWRVNSRGEFNVPYGHIAKPLICDEELLRSCSKRLTGAQIRLSSYVSAVNDAKEGDVVYLDPPYLPLSPSSSFSKYAKDDFLQLDHYAMAGVIRGLSERGVYVMLSNSDAPLTRQIFGGLLELRGLDVTRSISAGAAGRVKVGEVLGVNYKPAGPVANLPLLVSPVVSNTATGLILP